MSLPRYRPLFVCIPWLRATHTHTHTTRASQVKITVKFAGCEFFPLLSLSVGTLVSVQAKFTVKIALCWKPKTLASGVFYCEFRYRSHEWSCAYLLASARYTRVCPRRTTAKRFLKPRVRDRRKVFGSSSLAPCCATSRSTRRDMIASSTCRRSSTKTSAGKQACLITHPTSARSLLNSKSTTADSTKSDLEDF